MPTRGAQVTTTSAGPPARRQRWHPAAPAPDADVDVDRDVNRIDMLTTKAAHLGFHLRRGAPQSCWGRDAFQSPARRARSTRSPASTLGDMVRSYSNSGFRASRAAIR